ncbi:NAD(P)/FAD-dependent oxidoreductase [Paraburkholderia pallida]|uniref:FAD-dependent oxidoreductase n=1 Tax=Paraburkholderia pallida TaxID=2547399 RepID=A0A4P7D531_9BURK|nr:FAD-dependent oxidoreductase [Paraburkholderia pallida]QBR03931.1 FAD-dependent oxidoreductase [Paraburkholderia pallida]
MNKEPDSPETQADRSGVTRRGFLKGALATAVIAPAIAAELSTDTAPIENAKLVADLEKYRTLGTWVEKPADIQPELEGDQTADVVIVGAGYVGLHAALGLAAAGKKVIVLEREFAGFGASGRNAGYLGGPMALEYDLFVKRVGNEQAARILGFYAAGVDFVEKKLQEHAIECDYNATGVIRAGVDPSQEKRIRDDMATAAGLGFSFQFLDQAAMRARGIPPAFLFGSYAERGGTLHPGKYVMGLRRAALQAGVKLYENTALLAFAEGATVKVQTGKGSASAPFLIFATNAYTPQIGLLADKVAPLRVSAIETEPLSAEQRASLGWPKREGIITAHWTMESHRLTVNNTLIVTTKRLNYVYGSKTPNVPDSEAYQALRVALHERFPTLPELEIRACWSGYVSLAGDALPVVGAMGAQQNIFYSAGCSGHGVGTQSLMGHLLAERILGTEDPLLSALNHETPWLPPEPFRWCGIKGAMGITNTLDDQVDRRVRERRTS